MAAIRVTSLELDYPGDGLLYLDGERFGPPTPQAEAAVRAITDTPRLQRLARHVFHATGWDDLLATE